MKKTKQERKAPARRRSIKRHCKLFPGNNQGGLCSGSRILNGKPVCIVFKPCKPIDDLKACPGERK